MRSPKYSATKGCTVPVSTSWVFRSSMACRALARMMSGFAWFIFWLDYSRRRGWPRWRLRKVSTGPPRREARIQREGRREEPSVYRIDAAAQTARCHDHHFGCWRGITQGERHPTKAGGKLGRGRSTHRTALDYGQSRGTRP